MKLRILSDLHLENKPFDLIPYDEDILILAGDISNNPSDSFNLIQKYLDETMDKEVIFVMGNHDYFNDTVLNRVKYWEYFGKELSNRFHFLNRRSVLINGVEFFGATLWSNIDLSKGSRTPAYADFRYIYKTGIYGKITIHDYKDMFERDLKALRIFLDQQTENTRVVITHHLPSEKSVVDKYKNHPMHDLFVTELDYLMEDVKLWVHGHTHSSLSYTLNQTRVVCNPRGHPGENPAFEENLIVEI